MTVVIASRRRALLILSLILAGSAIAVASLYPRLQLPGVGEGFDLVFHGAAYGIQVILGDMLRRRLRQAAPRRSLWRKATPLSTCTDS